MKRSLAIVILLAGCAAKPAPAPEPRIITVDVPRIVQQKCADQRGPATDYPDTDEKLSLIADTDFEALSKAARAGRDLRIARLQLDEVQIKACAQ